MDENHYAKWSRILSPKEKMMYQCHNTGFMIIRYTLRLCSKNPLEEEKVRMVLVHLQRKVPTLRLCIQHKEDGELWLLARDNEVIDFQMGDASLYNKEHRNILYQQFDTSAGPLWRVRLFPCLPNTPFHMESLREKFPNQYDLLFAFHHSITDGMSNIRICNTFLKILNDVILNNIVNDDEQLGHNVTSRELEEVKASLLKNEEEIKYLNDFNENVKKVELLIHKGYPSEFPDIPSIEITSFELSEDETKKFTLKCKSERVTMNSALCTAVHVASVDLLKKADIIKDIYTFSHLQLVNIRRYFSIINSFPLGNCVGCVFMASNVPANIEDKFWDLAREFEREFSYLLKIKSPVKEALVEDAESINRDKILNTLLPKDSKDFLNLTYVMSNCGDLNNIFNGEGEYVQVTHLSRCTSFNNLVSSHEAHTFRGKLFYSIDYDQTYFSQKGAQLWCDTILKILKQVMEAVNI